MRILPLVNNQVQNQLQNKNSSPHFKGFIQVADMLIIRNKELRSGIIPALNRSGKPTNERLIKYVTREGETTLKTMLLKPDTNITEVGKLLADSERDGVFVDITQYIQDIDHRGSI